MARGVKYEQRTNRAFGSLTRQETKFGDLRSQEPSGKREDQRSECDTQLTFLLIHFLNEILKLGRTRISEAKQKAIEKQE